MNTPIRKITALAMSSLMVFSLTLAPAAALAESSASLQSKLDAANEKLNELNATVLDANESLNETEYELEQKQAELDKINSDIESTKEEIEEKEAELDEARSSLGDRVSSDYKSGPVSFLSIILNSNSFEDFVSRVYYADKVSESENAAISEVETLKSDLEDQKSQLEEQQEEQEQIVSDQEALVAEQKERTAAAEAAAADQQSYVDSLDAEVQEALEREQAEAAAAAQAAAASAAANTSSGGSSSGGSSSGGSSSGGSSSSGSLTSAQRNIIISAAYSALGTPYVYGGSTPGVGIDCSGLAQYAYAQAGISLPHYSQAQMAMCAPLSSPSSLQAGDLVFWTSPKHVAIYLGNNQIIEAVPGGVRVCAIWGACVGGGCPV